jgi:tetratricopeptide (TPR) repeat protein
VYCTEDLWSLVRLVPADIDALVADAPATNSDRNLFVELRAPLTLYSVTLETSWEAIARFPDGVLPLLADVGEPLDAERLGALAFSYARQRSDTTVASRLLGLALARGASAHALATEAYLNRDTLTPSERLSRLDAAVALRPDARPPRMLRAEARLEMGQYEGALADVETVLRDDPQDWRLRQLRATLLQSAGRHREAASELHDLLAHGHLERDAELLRAAGESYLALERLPEAIDALERSARIEPNFAYTWGVLSTAYERAGLASEADRARENLGIVRRNRLLMLHSESRRAIWMGSREFAIERLLTALALDPTYEPARNDLDRLTQEEAGSRPP